MAQALNPKLCRHVAERLGQEVVESSRVAGGDIHTAYQVLLGDGQRAFLKTQSIENPLAGVFEAEATGLRALSRVVSDHLRVPQVLAVETDFLVLEWLTLSGSPSGFGAALGAAVATMHQNTAEQTDGFGFARSTYLGRLPLANQWCRDWMTFFCDQRWHPLVERLEKSDDTLRQWSDRLMGCLQKVLNHDDAPSVLVHGDLWTGNAGWVDDRPAIYDPAAFYAPREFELGMTSLYGHGDVFVSGYESVWPLATGWRERVALYRLYHLLNHWWHFGGAYRHASLDAIRRLTERFA